VSATRPRRAALSAPAESAGAAAGDVSGSAGEGSGGRNAVAATAAGATGGALAPTPGPPAVRIEDPLALFVPERFLVGTVPLPLYLLELVPGSVKADYERTASGTVATRATASAGARCATRAACASTSRSTATRCAACRPPSTTTTSSPSAASPTRAASTARATSSTRLPRRPPRRRPQRRAIGGEQVEAVKRAFARFGGLILYTRLDVDYSDRSTLVRAGPRHPLVPDGAPPVREREGKHWVLEYDVEAERRRDASYNSIERLRINPLWLDQAAAGIAAWMDVELHNALRSGYAKRLLQLFTVRAARGWRVFDPWVLDLRELYDLLEVPPRQWGKTQTRAGVTGRPPDARRARRARRGRGREQGKGRYELRLAAGERLLAAGYQRGTGGADGVADRMLLWHLRALGFGAPQARELVRTRPDQVRTVLRRVYYLRRTRPGSPTAARSRTGARGRAPPSRATTPSATPTGSAGSPTSSTPGSTAAGPLARRRARRSWSPAGGWWRGRGGGGRRAAGDRHADRARRRRPGGGRAAPGAGARGALSRQPLGPGARALRGRRARTRRAYEAWLARTALDSVT
jgi:hypothetical protein